MGFEVHFGDWREIRGKLFKVRDQLEKSCRDPEVKTSIYQRVYDSGIPNENIPVDTGALYLSPDSQGGATPMGKGRYAHGTIDENGISYDPYSVRTPKDDEDGGEREVHYADYIRKTQDWNPQENVENDIVQGYGNSVILEIVKEELINNVKH